jgi:hypothetical protein
MQALLRTLQDHDLGHLRIVAELWGIDLPSGPALEAARALAQAMLDPAAALEQAESLPPSARQTLDFLLRSGGRFPLADLLRQLGPLREMGPGRRDREKPWRDPASPLEVLWYRGLIARAFAETPTGPQEFAFVPSDLRPLLPAPAPTLAEPLGCSAAPPAWSAPASTAAPDDATTLLAALRRRSSSTLPPAPARMASLGPFLERPETAGLLLTLLHQEGVLSGPPFRPSPEAIRHFLDAPRPEANRALLNAWLRSSSWNDLAHLPHLQIAGPTWPNDPIPARQALVDLLRHIPTGDWWDLEAFVATVHDSQPGFQRPAGDFDSWYVREAKSGAFLRGFEHWETVDGALLRFLIAGPLHWLGVLDLGGPGPETPPTAFRQTPLAASLQDPHVPLAEEGQPTKAALRADGSLVIPHDASRSLRYQVARFCAWEGRGTQGYTFRLTPASLQAAAGQGLKQTHMVAVLESATGRSLPEPLHRGLARWARRGREAWMERPLALRLESAAVLRELNANPATARYLGESLGPTTVVILDKDWERLCAAAAKIGLLIQPPAPRDESP